jgi:2-methylisocitrate lyase-like PEP mutase family enzyme
MQNQSARGQIFKQLHEREGLFLMPNPWDAGSTRILTELGFEALASTSAGLAFSLGKPDGERAVGREETLANLIALTSATHLPVSADLENGFGDAPEICAETILMAAQSGVVGASIEDATGKKEDPIYPFELSVERIRASVAAARSLPFPFTLTARAENLIHGRPDLQDTIQRLEAYAAAGADVLYAPGLNSAGEIGQVVRALAPHPVNLLANPSKDPFSISQLEALGVKRVSLGSGLARAAYHTLISQARYLGRKTSLEFAGEMISYEQINGWFRQNRPV